MDLFRTQTDMYVHHFNIITIRVNIICSYVLIYYEYVGEYECVPIILYSQHHHVNMKYSFSKQECSTLYLDTYIYRFIFISNYDNNDLHEIIHILKLNEM